MASIVAVSGIMVALYGRRNDPSGRGRHLDISVQEAASIAACQTSNANLFTWRGEVPQRPGMTRGVFRCSDGGWVTLNVVEESFPAFMEWLGGSGIETDLDERLDEAGMAGLILMPEVLELAGRLAERHTRQEFLDRALSMDMLSLPVHDFPDLARSEQLRAAGQFFEVWDEPLGRALDFSRSPVDVFERPAVISRAPTLGEHNFLLREMEDCGEPPSQSSPAEPGEEVRASSPPRQLPALLTEPEQLLRPFPYLKGVRVVDLCWILAGPLGTKVLADFGAEVIKIETDAHPRMRRVGARPDGAPGPNVDPLFNGANTGKLSVSLDLRTERGKKTGAGAGRQGRRRDQQLQAGRDGADGTRLREAEGGKPGDHLPERARMRPDRAVVAGADAGEHDHGGVGDKRDHRLSRPSSVGHGGGISRLHDAVPDGGDGPGGAAGEGTGRARARS